MVGSSLNGLRFKWPALVLVTLVSFLLALAVLPMRVETIVKIRTVTIMRTPRPVSLSIFPKPRPTDCPSAHLSEVYRSTISWSCGNDTVAASKENL
jgi:hypothetical protein